MYQYDHKIRVRYGETDQMGTVYYGNYAAYYEAARVESLRDLGFIYREMEEKGIMLPVIENHSYFMGPAHYDELITIRTRIPELPRVRIKFEYEVYNEKNDLINTGNTILAFINRNTGVPTRPPKEIMDTLAPFF